MSILLIGVVGIPGRGIIHGRRHGITIHGMVHRGILLTIGDGIVIGAHHGILAITQAIIHATHIITTITQARQLIVRPLLEPIDLLAPDKTIMLQVIDPAIEEKVRLIDHHRVEVRQRKALQCQVEDAHQVAVMPEYRREIVTQVTIEAHTIARQVAVKIVEALIALREAVAVVVASQVEVAEAVAEAEVVVDAINRMSVLI